MNILAVAIAHAAYCTIRFQFDFLILTGRHAKQNQSQKLPSFLALQLEMQISITWDNAIMKNEVTMIVKCSIVSLKEKDF